MNAHVVVATSLYLEKFSMNALRLANRQLAPGAFALVLSVWRRWEYDGAVVVWIMQLFCVFLTVCGFHALAWRVPLCAVHAPRILRDRDINHPTIVPASVVT